MKKRRDTTSVATTLPTREQVLEFVRSQPGKVGKREISKAFDVAPADKIALKRLLREMAENGEIEKRGKRLRHPGSLAPVEVLLVTGRDADGELVAEPTDWDEEDHGAAPRILIEHDRGGRGKPRAPAPGVGDRVLARIAEARHGEFALVGRVIKVIDRKPKSVIGVVAATEDGGGLLRSVDKKERRDLVIAPADMGGARDGDLVSVELTRGTRLGPPRARVTDRIGDMQSEHAVSLIALLSHDIPIEFPDDVLREAEEAEPAPFANREDLRHVPLVTIDPPDAKDHDDAIYAEPDPENEGGFVLYVAIADVAHYVTPGSALDREALKRGNSVYFPDRVVPMLPERLSGDLCSLMEREDRPALVAVMKIGGDGRMTGHRFTRAMIRVAANVHYVQAQQAIDGHPDAATDVLLDPVLKPLWQCYERMAAARDAREPLELEIPERKLVLGADGKVERVVVPPRLDAHKLVEVSMIMANVAAAETLERERTPLLYRAHDAPSQEKLAALSDFLASLDLKLPKAGVLRPSHFNGILKKVGGSENEQLVHEVVLRSQAQAEYAPGNFGHFGLNLRRYAHFTSPIRRYADLVVHRALVRALDLGRDGLRDEEIQRLEEIGAQISATERRAMAAERETVDRLIANFLADQVGATFAARIGGVTRAGLFVRLRETGADGFIPASTIGNDYYVYDEVRQRMVGDRTGEAHTLGDEVTVRLVEAAPLAGALRFELVSEGRYLSGRNRPAPGGPRARKPVRKGRPSPAGKGKTRGKR
ncbi:ribonuclease R [Lutibaculum baratangense]|uniref:Ribonuclease R n=1 Tax=Lutibaculum baratangense AMV1 TaxID=631454 RepID=V4QV15_9HYPH|nr:ribonuclease R [Lutibaculum baratangense]ESR23597.1 3'-to-5' exoribonuclease RNase R [Lutibaculum baratangense AMV1]